MGNRYAKMDEEDAKKAQPVKKNRYAMMDEEDAKPTVAKKPTPKVPAAALPKPGKKDYTWSEAFAAAPYSARQGVADALEGAGNLAYDLVTSPRDTSYRMGGVAADVAMAVGNIGAGAYTNMLDPVTKGKLVAADPRFGRASATADAVGEWYAGYRKPAVIRQRIAETPIALLADAASLGTLPGVAQAGRAVARALPTSVARTANAARYVAVPTHAVNDATAYVAGRVIPAAARKVETVARPVNATMMRAAEGRGPQAAAALRAAAPIVPNSPVSTAQALTPAGTPGLSAIAKSAERARPAEQLAQTTAQNQARVDHLGTIGVPDAQLPGAVADRAADATRNYAAAGAVTVPFDADLATIARSPSMRDAYRLAQAIAAERRAPFPSTPGAFSGDDIQLMKMALDDMAYDGALAARHGIARSQQTAIQGTRADFLRWAEARNPEFNNARTTFRDQSQPIDQTLIRQELGRSLENPALGDATINQRAGAFANATRDSATRNPVLNKAGAPRYNNLDEIFTPDQMGVVDDINRDFSRAGLAEQQAAMGAPEFGGSLNSIKSDALGIDLNGPYAWAGRILARGGDRYYGNQVTNAMMTPEGAAGLMENALTREQTIARYNQVYGLGRNVATYINPARWANRYPTLYNAMNAQEQQPQ